MFCVLEMQQKSGNGCTSLSPNLCEHFGSLHRTCSQVKHFKMIGVSVKNQDCNVLDSSVLRFQCESPKLQDQKGRSLIFTFSFPQICLPIQTLSFGASLYRNLSICIFDVSVPCLYVYLQWHFCSEDCDPVISRCLIAVLISKERLLLPGLWVESYEAVTLHFDPTHFLADVGPPLVLQKGSSA